MKTVLPDRPELRSIDNPVVAFAVAAWNSGQLDADAIDAELGIYHRGEFAGTIAGCSWCWLDWLRVIDLLAGDGTLCRWACAALMTDELALLGVTA